LLRSIRLEDEALAQGRATDPRLLDAGRRQDRIQHRDAVNDQIRAVRIQARGVPAGRER
jgi:hypothetical protein